MPRTTDDSRRSEARRLYAMRVSSARIAEQLGVDRRTVQRWCADIVRPRGAQPNPAVSGERIIEMRDREGLSWAEIAAQTALRGWSSARSRYWAAKGIPRPERRRGVRETGWCAGCHHDVYLDDPRHGADCAEPHNPDCGCGEQPGNYGAARS